MTEIEKLLAMNYEECCNYLNNKYGAVPKDYFTDERCRNKNKINSKTNYGLVIHHIDEDKAIMLSNPEYAIQEPFSYQRANRLVYCNLLEHLVLHIKIFEYTNWKNLLINKGILVGVGGIYNYLVPELNDIYSGIKYKLSWKENIRRTVAPLKEDYFKCIKKIIDLDFHFPLLNSFSAQFNLWENKKNEELYCQLRDIGVRN